MLVPLSVVLGFTVATAHAAAAAPKNVITILIDDLGSYDTAVNNPDIGYITPNLKALSDDGLKLKRFYTYMYCSPTRRAFLSGRFPVHMSGAQAQPCDNTLPFELEILPQKLKKASTPWATHFIGKGHLGYPTTDHLPINRGFDSHAGYLMGAEDYDYGFNENRNSGHDCAKTMFKECIYDLWHDDHTGVDVHGEIYYSTNWYTERAQSIVVSHNANASQTPLWIHLMYQGVHSPYVDPPAWEGVKAPSFWDQTFADMLHVVDAGIGNLTSTLHEQGMWEDTLLIITADNGGIGPGNNYPFRGMKATPWEGGTRVMGFLSGGFLPANLRGGAFHRVIGVQDWYPTLCGFAGVDPTDNAVINGVMHPIDGVDVWPAILASANATATTAAAAHTAGAPPPPPVTYLHEWMPTTQFAVIYQERWKLISGASSTQWYTPNNTKVPDHWPCRGGKPPSPSPPPPGPCTAVDGYACHALHFCGPRQSFYAQSNVGTALACAALCSANSTGCGCFDFMPVDRSRGDGSSMKPGTCRLHANHGDQLAPSSGYTAYVKAGAGANVDSWDSRVVRDTMHEEQLARDVMIAYEKTQERKSPLPKAGCSVCTHDEPCLFDVIADPSETIDVSKANPTIVTTIQKKIATGVFQAYIGAPMNATQLAGYDCPTDIRPWWGNFSGPCCKPK